MRGDHDGSPAGAAVTEVRSSAVSTLLRSWRPLLAADPDGFPRRVAGLLERLRAGATVLDDSGRVEPDPGGWEARLHLVAAYVATQTATGAAGAHIEAALRRADPEREPVLVARLLMLRAVQDDLAGAVERTIADLTAAAALLAGRTDEEARRVAAMLRTNLAWTLFDLGDADGAIELLEQSADDPTAVPGREHRLLVAAAVVVARHLVVAPEESVGAPQGPTGPGGDTATGVGHPRREHLRERVVAWTDRLDADPADPSDLPGLATALLARLCRCSVEEDHDALLRAAPRALAAATACARTDVVANVHHLRGETLLRLGRVQEAVPALEAARAVREVPHSTAATSATLLLSRCRAAQRRWEEALADMEAYVRLTTRARDVRLRAEAAVASARTARAEAEAQRDQAHAETRRARLEARLDPLTGVGNRRAFSDAVAALEPGHEVGLALVDLDHFKQVNDTFGHPVGDTVLRRVAAVLSALAHDRSGLRVFRLGGEEFALLITDPGTDAARAAEQAREAVARLDLGDVAPGLRVTVSVGLTCGAAVRTDGRSEVDRLLEDADHNLYRAKRRGRDRVAVG